MHIATIIYTFFFGKFVGHDQAGNSYYKNRLKGKKEKRWVIYKGIIESSKVPALWHRWLHFTTDSLPEENKRENFSWQKSHQPNFTGTSKANNPSTTSENKLKYQPWKPHN
jgi:NADH:ubiquinone oxidoreductase subunit